MAATPAIKYLSLGEPSGYGLSGLAYVRGLLNAGRGLWWVPQVWSNLGLVGWTPRSARDGLDLLRLSDRDAALTDLPAIIRATWRPHAHDVAVTHLVPDHWSCLMEPGRVNVGYTMWEMDRLPDSWPAMLDLADRILVPDTRTRDLFTAAGLRSSIHIVPHVRRHVWNRFDRQELLGLRRQWGIGETDHVFYSINTWEPRKAIPDLLEAYIAEFDADEPVALIIKTSAKAARRPDSQERAPTRELADAAIDDIRQRLGKERLPRLILIDARIGGREIDALHHLGDCFVSLSHGECWNLGAFDAATLGKPVIVTGWGGHCDYLGHDHPGLVRYRMTPVEPWVAYGGFQSNQNWATADQTHARQLLREHVERSDLMRGRARALQPEILTRYGEPAVTRTLLEALQ